MRDCNGDVVEIYLIIAFVQTTELCVKLYSHYPEFIKTISIKQVRLYIYAILDTSIISDYYSI